MRLKRRDLRVRIVILALHLAAVDDEDNIIDRDRGLRDVRRQDDLAYPLGHAVEDHPLLLDLDLRVQLHHAHACRISHHDVRLQKLGRLRDRRPAREKDEDRAVPTLAFADVRKQRDEEGDVDLVLVVRQVVCGQAPLD